MTEVLTPDRGAFCFAELQTSDVNGSAQFFRDLFGWTTADVPGAHGDYLLFQLDGRDVAGLRRTDGGKQRWIPYVFVENIASTTARAAQIGGVDSAPVVTPGIGRTCLLRDAEGAELGLWEAGGHQGARVVDVTGSMWWIELMSSDVTVARRFYTSLFGWSYRETDKYGLPFPYTVFTLGEQSVAGAAQSLPEWGLKPNWGVFFATDSFTETVKRACAMGGSLGFWRDVPAVGRLGVIGDPHGGTFIVMHPNQLPALS